jgi:S-adenosylmethionine/arginine decarboxylase-like enzyme
MSFGPHIFCDLEGCDLAAINDLGLVSKFLAEVPPAIGMTVIAPPYTFPYSGKVPEDEGITGIVVLAESHCSVHFFPQR